MNKKMQLSVLAEKRRNDDPARLNPRYRQVGALSNGIFDAGGHVSPWTNSANNVDASLMIMGQDWISSDAENRPCLDAALGYDPTLDTNKNLQSLLRKHFQCNFTDVYATNLFVFVKPGDMGEYIPIRDMMYSAKTYAVPQIDIVNPRAVICLGRQTFNILCRAINKEAPNDKNSSPMVVEYGKVRIYGVPHTGRRGTANAGGLVKVDAIWAALGLDLNKNERPH